MAWGLEINNGSGARTLSTGDSSAVILGYFDVQGKTASSIGASDGDRSFTIHGIPANCKGWVYIYSIVNNDIDSYDARAYVINHSTITYRIDDAPPGVTTRLVYGYRGK